MLLRDVHFLDDFPEPLDPLLGRVESSGVDDDRTRADRDRVDGGTIDLTRHVGGRQDDHVLRGDLDTVSGLMSSQALESEVCTFSSDALSQLKQYSWPGNIRELKNVCQHVSALLPGEVIHKENLPLDIRECKPSSNTGYTLPEHGIDMESLEIDLIKQALNYSGGNKSKAAKLLGLSRDAFLYRLKKHNL